MTQFEQVKEVELVRPQGPATIAVPTAPHAAPASNGWIAVVVGFVLVGNAVLVWRRVTGRDPLRRAFRSAAREAGLDHRERSLIEELAGEANPPVTLLITDTALDRAGAKVNGDSQDAALLVGVRQKLSRVQG